IVTLENQDGVVELGVGPEVKRFDELKGGDSVTFTYVESVLAEIHKAAPADKAPATSDPQVTRGKGPRPSGMVSQTQKATGKIQAIDANAPSVKGQTPAGKSRSL